MDGIKKDLEEAINFKGNRMEQLLMIFCRQLKLKYEKLTEEEKRCLVQIISKSELLKSSIPQRKKKKNS